MRLRFDSEWPDRIPPMYIKVKKKVWQKLEPHWPKLRDFLVNHSFVWHEPGRQRWHLGWLRKDRPVEDFINYMSSQGFKHHLIAWVDEDELMSLRKHDGIKHQYHLRVFKDGEVRGHYEVSPEGGLIKHFFEKGMEERREEFMKMLGDWITS